MEVERKQLDEEVIRLREENKQLRAALKPFAKAVFFAVQDMGYYRKAYDVLRALGERVDPYPEQ
jgi:hypothetical protein